MRAPLLVELLTEELPPKSLQRLGSAFAGAIAAGLAQAGLVDAAAAAASRGYCTPRRLAVLVPDVAAQAAAREIQVKGPSVAIGLGADGQPTVALRKWAERQGAALDALTRGSDGKQEVFFWRSVAAGAALADAIQGILDAALASLPIAKVMKYQLADGATTVSFVRPAHRLVVLHGAEVVPCRVLGLDAGRLTEGHRFRSHGAVAIEQADAYPELLAAHHVIAGFDDRRAAVAAAIEAQRSALGAQLAVGAAEQAQVAALLDEVTALVESPAVYVGAFDAAYLQVPQECLILSMRTNQKYFPLFDADGRLQNRFLIVSNMAIADPSAIIDGNQRVVRPRLADARFFYDQDRRQPLADRVGRLASVVYHARLGAQADRVRRIGQLAAAIGGALGVPAPAVARAALLAKADLLTGMVGEFPELQGIMGRYYARHDGEPEDVATAIAEHYQPRFAGDALPASPVGTVIALADKLETLAGIWGVGQRPSGDRDPFALRRHALGVIRMLVEKALPLSLGGLLADAFGAFSGVASDAKAPFERDVGGLRTFVVDRLRGYLRERGFEAGDVDAALAVDADRLDRIESRLVAIAEFRLLPEFEALASANKRIANLLRKSGGGKSSGDTDQAPAGAAVDPQRLVEPAERALHDALAATAPEVERQLAALDYGAALKALAGLRTPVDAFFDTVMVNADDAALRANRQALLARLSGLMNRVADLGRL